MALRPVKRGGVRRYSDLNPANVPILNSEMDADLDPLYAGTGGLWVANYPRMTLAVDRAISESGAAAGGGIYGLEFGGSTVGSPVRTRLYGMKTDIELTYNFGWSPALATSVFDDPAEPCITLDIGTAIGDPNAQGIDCNFLLSYHPPGGDINANWCSPFNVVLWSFAHNNSDICELGLGSMKTSSKTRLLHYGMVNSAPAASCELSVNCNEAGVPDNQALGSWSIDIAANPGNDGITFGHRIPGSAPLAWVSLLSIGPTGDLQIAGSNATKQSGTAWINPSDPRLKMGIVPYVAGLAELRQIEAKMYRLKSEPDVLCYGFDAEAVRPILPECVGTAKIGDEEYLTFDMSPMLVAMLNAVKELSNRVMALESK